jgi:hypothetical protein
MRRPVSKRAMILTQDEVETLKNMIRAGKAVVINTIKGTAKGNEIKELETAMNAFGKATTRDNEEVLDPKVKYS